MAFAHALNSFSFVGYDSIVDLVILRYASWDVYHVPPFGCKPSNLQLLHRDFSGQDLSNLRSICPPSLSFSHVLCSLSRQKEQGAEDLCLLSLRLLETACLFRLDESTEESVVKVKVYNYLRRVRFVERGYPVIAQLAS